MPTLGSNPSSSARPAAAQEIQLISRILQRNRGELLYRDPRDERAHAVSAPALS